MFGFLMPCWQSYSYHNNRYIFGQGYMTCLRSSKQSLKPSKTKYPLGKHPSNLMPYKIIPRYGIGAWETTIRPTNNQVVSFSRANSQLYDFGFIGNGGRDDGTSSTSCVTIKTRFGLQQSTVNLPCRRFFVACFYDHGLDFRELNYDGVITLSYINLYITTYEMLGRHHAAIVC